MNNGSLEFSDGGNAEVVLTVRSGELQQVIQLHDSWNYIGANVVPNDLRLENIYELLVERETLIRVKNDGDGFCAPEFNNFNSIGDWVVTEGYMVKMNAPDSLILTGLPIPYNRPIEVV